MRPDVPHFLDSPVQLVAACLNLHGDTLMLVAQSPQLTGIAQSLKSMVSTMQACTCARMCLS